MEIDPEVTPPVTPKKKVDKSEPLPDSPGTKHENKKTDKKIEGEDPKPRIVLTFRSEKAGAKTSTMKIVPTEDKHEEISPRRSARTRHGRAWAEDSDDDSDILLPPTKKNKSHHTSETDETSDSSLATPKRSMRRRSREFENVIANAIARKEKSYNEIPTPSRPSRRIKPTAKVLANEELKIESQSGSRGVHIEKSPEEGVRTRRSVRGRHNIQEEIPITDKKDQPKKDVPESDNDSNQVMKLKHLCELGLKAIDPDDEDSKDDGETAEDSEAIEIDDESFEDEEVDDDTEVISKLLADDGEDSDDEYLSPSERQGSRRKRATRSTRRILKPQYWDVFPDERKRGTRSVRLAKKIGNDIGFEDGAFHAYLEKQKRSSRTTSRAKASNLRSTSSTNRRKRLRSTTASEVDEEEDSSEPAGGDDGSEAACPIDEDSPIAAKCKCETPTNIYADSSELTEPVFCQAIELVDGIRVGCSHGAVKEEDGSYSSLVRAGLRSPYFQACKLHVLQLRKHMCCPTCGLFCSQGTFYQCSLGHLFHLECGLPYNDCKSRPGCPHCGVNTSAWMPANKECFRVKVQMHCSNKRIFLPDQREQCTPAYLGFSTLDPSHLDQGPVIPEDLLPSPPIDPKRLCEKPDMEDDPFDAAEALCEAILAGEETELLIPKIIAASNLNIPLPSLNGGSAVHAAVRRGHLLALHLLHTAGADLDATAAGRTPLMLAVLTLLDKPKSKSGKKPKTNDKDSEEMEADHSPESKEESDKDGDKVELKESEIEMEMEKPSDEQLMKIIRYLVAAGCDVNIPGPDGMTALHMAAQHGGTAVCRVILSSASALVDPRDQGGWSPLVWAAENCHDHTVRFLLSNGADATATDAEGNSVIHWCALAGSTRPLQLLLDAAPETVNALNVNTDTPLHVAARQEHYACVIILLARGARTDVENTAGELPTDVCGGRCHAAISLNMQMTLAVCDKLTRRRLLSSDISRGREQWAVPCVNEVDDALLPADFTYVTSHVTPHALNVDNTLQSLQGCSCSDSDCSSASCGCGVLSVRRWWAGGRLPAAFPFHDPPMLFQCNDTCGCNAKKCTNSVITRLCKTGSMFVRATVFRVGGARGWGLRTQGQVPRGTPVATYVGELLDMTHADTRSADQYMFALDVKPDLLEQCSDKSQLCVDAAAYGGAARFINHSCRPNLAPVRVFTTTRDLRLPTIALFACRDIHSGEELTFDYGDKFWSVKAKYMQCECDAPDCRYPSKAEENEA